MLGHHHHQQQRHHHHQQQQQRTKTTTQQQLERNEIRSYLQHLSQASKQGNTTSALLWLGQINTWNCKRYGNGISKIDEDDAIQPLTLYSLRYIFHPTLPPSQTSNTNTNPTRCHDKDSALYYAAINGKYDLVEYYLSLYLIYSLNITFGTMHITQSFRSWFIQLNKYNDRNHNFETKKKKRSENFHTIQTSTSATTKSHKRNEDNRLLLSSSSHPFFFDLSDYDQCVADSNSKQVINIMVKKKINIGYAMKVVQQASFSCLPYKQLIEPRMEQIYFYVKRITENARRMKHIKTLDSRNERQDLNLEEVDVDDDDDFDRDNFSFGDYYNCNKDYSDDFNDAIDDLIAKNEFECRGDDDGEYSHDFFSIHEYMNRSYAELSNSPRTFLSYFTKLEEEEDEDDFEDNVILDQSGKYHLPPPIHSISYLDIEDDLVSIEVELRKKNNKKGERKDQQHELPPIKNVYVDTLNKIHDDDNDERSNCDSNHDNDERTYFTLQTMITRATWLPPFLRNTLSLDQLHQQQQQQEQQKQKQRKHQQQQLELELQKHLQLQLEEKKQKQLEQKQKQLQQKLEQQQQQVTVKSQEKDVRSKGGSRKNVVSKMKKEKKHRVLKDVNCKKDDVDGKRMKCNDKNKLNGLKKEKKITKWGKKSKVVKIKVRK